MADLQSGTVDEGNPGRLVQTFNLQIDHQWSDGSRDQRNETGITDHFQTSKPSLTLWNRLDSKEVLDIGFSLP
jgi:hypothetical protein